jgi:hypothetical protein
MHNVTPLLSFRVSDIAQLPPRGRQLSVRVRVLQLLTRAALEVVETLECYSMLYLTQSPDPKRHLAQAAVSLCCSRLDDTTWTILSSNSDATPLS